jgi:hypothetical protein
MATISRMWFLIRIRDEWGAFWWIGPAMPRLYPGAHLEILARLPERRALAIYDWLDARRLLAE